jgi:hypothetical protein
VKCSSLSLVLVMFSLFCPLLRQTRTLHEDMEVDKIMRTLLTLGANSSTPRRHGSGQNNAVVLVMFSLFCPLPSLRGVLELAPIVSNDLFIFSPLPYLREVLPRRHGSGQNNEYITNTRGKLEHSTKTWKWTK